MSRKNIETRNRILNAAWTLLETAPEKGVRMADIAKEAGISRQAVYLHFPKRAELLKAVTRYIDDVKDVDKRLEKSRNAQNGVERLEAFIEAWGNYIPEIYGVIKAVWAMKETDAEAKEAWEDRWQAVREGCEAAVYALKDDRKLRTDLSVKEATDLLWVQLSVGNWELLVRENNWRQEQYVDQMKEIAIRYLIKN
ncbi:TetR family transcriptional regulator [Sneathiella sp. P13V-1]|uniref:TetR/AcrR family transcriptional regulator n=1 Tax=Sneathiella sp. P13V-1 TaxID=2697366 RepID=UPI00187B11C0|nr:TetR/AcrR family transcriptional regulator [Sneathiella sp. P13V-1]MBE7638208.1 TetR family transcriptional regulator [Sneathiella sp. P13V-1]